MPYRRYGKKKSYAKRSRRTLAAKSIRKRTGAKSQSRQIAKLARQVRAVNKRTTSTLTTKWQRASLKIQSVLGGETPFVLPLPVAAMDPLQTFTGAITSDTTQWCDNLRASGATQYVKQLVFGQAGGELINGDVYHSGQVIKWQLENFEATHSTVDMFVVQPRKICADDLIAARGLKTDRNSGSTTPIYGPPSDGGFIKDLDYVVHDANGSLGYTYFGAKWNPKMWKVLYHRTINFASTGDEGPNKTVGSPGYNTHFAQGTIRLPAAGKMRSISASTNALIPGIAGQTQRCNGLEMGFADEANEDGRYLVLIQNGTSADQEDINFSVFGQDYYKVSN